MSKLFVVTVATVALVALGGCGGGDDDGDDRLSREEFVAKADAICAEANKKETAMNPGGPGWHSGPQFEDEEFMTEFNAIGRDAVRQLKALTPPEADQAKVDAVITHMETMVKAFDEQIAAIRADKKGTTAAIVTAYERAYADLSVVAGPLGLSECQGVSV